VAQDLIELCEEIFSPADMERGNQYAEANRVQIDSIEDDIIHATVTGKEEYEVTIDLSELDYGYPDLDCSCPRFEEGYLCKHLWATILEYDRTYLRRRRKPRQNGNIVATTRKRTPSWRQNLQKFEEIVEYQQFDIPTPVATLAHISKQYWFAIILPNHLYDGRLKISTYVSPLKRNGEWGVPVKRFVGFREVETERDLVDRQVLSLLRPLNNNSHWGYEQGLGQQHDTFCIPQNFQHQVLELLSSTDRFVWSLEESNGLTPSVPIRWDNGGPWMLKVELTKCNGNSFQLVPHLVRGDEQRGISDIVCAFTDGLVLFDGTMAELRKSDTAWTRAWHTGLQMVVPETQLDDFLNRYVRLPGAPELLFPESLKIRTQAALPQPVLIVKSEKSYGSNPNYLKAAVHWNYGDIEVPAISEQVAFFDAATRTWFSRDRDHEQLRLKELLDTPIEWKDGYSPEEYSLSLHTKWLPQTVTKLVPLGWRVVAEGKKFRSAGSFHIDVQSGIDWFDVQGHVDFEETQLSLPKLLEAIRNRQTIVDLDDGSRGMIPEEWLKKYSTLSRMGQSEGDSVKVSKLQAIMLDAMLAERGDVSYDRAFTSYLQKIQRFSSIAPKTPSAGFQGTLRSYQQEGLAWLEFLQDFDFGGCLADDMGLGKTVQVLALLEKRRARRLKKGESRLPSIVVVPKSLVFNWLDEASRFTPKLRVWNYTGTDRQQLLSQLGGSDLLITTYATLLRDIAELKDIEFDYIILDEAQAIKNSNTQQTKACRLLRGRYRLAMTGTPVENHLGELWSIFEFLNPGFLGHAGAFRDLTSASDTSDESLEWLRKCLKPFILRRTKAQVLKELPEKTEQTLYCEMNAKQAKVYRELRDHYRASLTNKIESIGLERSKIQVLEALLRLRQAACDPRLIDAKNGVEGSKIETLLEQLEDVIAEGHKALVFSQFTSMLALVRKELEARDWKYEYLDGSTRDRKSCVTRFQEDPDCSLFLISLKAGGHGLNLTAADYVYILDPWWNPAVESQAIDRAHRLGQTRSVMAYRIICQDTVEDKIVQLQQSKRHLADAIITANQSLIRELSADDLQVLFS
jgi:superfamily II DNA or RNA helicase